MNRALVSVVFAAALSLGACSRGGAGPSSGHDGADLAVPVADGDSDGGGGSSGDGGAVDGASGTKDLAGSGPDLRPPADLAMPPDLAPWMGVLTIKITVSNTCKITTDPPSISVPAGSTFTVNWVNSAASSYEVDISKRDPFNLVPIVLGLEIGNSYHDKVRSWCGAFRGTFWFRIDPGCGTFEIPVMCGP